jgi:hypothetical protein
MGASIDLTRLAGSGDGFRGDLPLEREFDGDIVLDATDLRSCHPMLALRLRLFVDWHLSAGHTVIFKGPFDGDTAQQLADHDRLAPSEQNVMFGSPSNFSRRTDICLRSSG